MIDSLGSLQDGNLIKKRRGETYNEGHLCLTAALKKLAAAEAANGDGVAAVNVYVAPRAKAAPTPPVAASSSSPGSTELATLVQSVQDLTKAVIGGLPKQTQSTEPPQPRIAISATARAWNNADSQMLRRQWPLRIRSDFAFNEFGAYLSSVKGLSWDWPP